jgi:pectinesterase
VDGAQRIDPSTVVLCWARFYDIATNRPIYVGRDGVIKERLADVEYERRTGYSCLGPFASDLLNKDYPAWKKRLATGVVSTPYITVRRRE